MTSTCAVQGLTPELAMERLGKIARPRASWKDPNAATPRTSLGESRIGDSAWRGGTGVMGNLASLPSLMRCLPQ